MKTTTIKQTVKTDVTANKKLLVEHYTIDDINASTCKNLVVGSYIVNNFKVFDTIRNSDENLKLLDECDITAKALKAFYKLENTELELSAMLSRAYNNKRFHEQKFKVVEVAKTDKSPAYTDEQFKVTIAKAFKDKMSEAQIVAKFRSLNVSDEILSRYFKNLKVAKKQEVPSTIF